MLVLGRREDDLTDINTNQGRPWQTHEYTMAWFYLFLAGLFEIAWAYGLKLTDGWTRFGPSVFTLLTMGVSFGLLSLAMRHIPMGTAYAVWTGIGIIGTAMIGMLVLGEPRNGFRLFCLALVVVGILGLKLS